MRQQSLFFAIVAAVTSTIFGLFLPSPEFTREQIIKPNETAVFQVAVVGKVTAQGTADSDARVGKDVWEGAQAFLKAHPEPFELIQIDDSDTTVTAKRKSDDLASSPRILAVIGHSRSATTQAAIKSYYEAGIPFIIPVATAQSAVYPSDLQKNVLVPSGTIANDFFRLRPSDDKAQAPAISFLVAKIADSERRANLTQKPVAVKVHLVISTNTNTSAYCNPLGDKIQELLRTTSFVPDKVDDDFADRDTEEIAKRISSEHESNDIVIFCGYYDEAKSFLAATKQAYQAAQKTPPNFIFTEAATDIENNPDFHELVIYRTAPDDVGRCELPSNMQGFAPSSEFVSGYDAVLILSIAAQRCTQDNHLSRKCLLKDLQSSSAFAGACRGYSFRHGESVLSNYYVFKSGAAPDLGDGRASSFEIPAGSIIQLEAADEVGNENN
jgi:ABC-type branched-subunit amino acid transport system substrate-binding protein